MANKNMEETEEEIEIMNQTEERKYRRNTRTNSKMIRRNRSRTNKQN